MLKQAKEAPISSEQEEAKAAMAAINVAAEGAAVDSSKAESKAEGALGEEKKGDKGEKGEVSESVREFA